jgi:eukaryotic-like serine/threonine-protein kinase
MRPAREVILERWAEVDQLFSDALGQPEAKRAAFLSTACHGDRELFDTVTSLLEESGLEGGDVSGPGADLISAAFEAGSERDVGVDSAVGAEPSSGDSVGPYRLVREIGRGGMATVFEAERADGAFETSVAIKILRGIDTGDVGRRFQAERQILSSLAHPNIARLLDGGTTTEGRPFLVMELVEGEPITSWADRRGLTTSDRLELFAQVAEAVLFAHSHLVVHRDIKPSNVLVSGDDGTVKLLDFGIAKLLEPGGDAQGETGTAAHWMTPRYASPEQILSGAITTATDVHALGLLLFELLTGRHPFQVGSSTSFELGRAISEDVPRLASTVVGPVTATRSVTMDEADEEAARVRGATPIGLRRRLAGDLDAVIAKALRKRPEDRYSSVQALLDDIQRHRTGFPVRAREGMWAYRTRKFVGRHRAGVAAAAAFALFVVASVTALARQQAVTEQERDRANAAAALATREADNARVVIGFLSDVFGGRDPREAPSDTITAAELLAWGRERVATEYGDRPEVQGDLYAVLGAAHMNLGLMDEGTELLERALALAREVHGGSSEQVASLLSRLGVAHDSNSESREAVGYLRAALELRQQLHGMSDPRTIEALVPLGTTLRDTDPDSAEVVLREALRLMEVQASPRLLVLRATLGLAFVLRGRGDLEEAEDLYRRAIPEALETAGFDEGALAAHLNNFAYLKRVRGDYVGADSLYRRALSLATDLYGRGHPTALMYANNLASTLGFLDRFDGALSVLEESLDAARAQWPMGHWRVGSAEVGLGRAYLRAGRPESAKATLERGIRSYTEYIGADHNWTYFAIAAYRVALIVADDDPQARRDLDDFYTNLRRGYDEAGGVLNRQLVDQVETLVLTLDDAGLRADAGRFRAILP